MSDAVLQSSAPRLYDARTIGNLRDWGVQPDAIEGQSRSSGLLLHKAADGKQFLLVKGAPEVILDHCDRQQSTDGQPTPIDRQHFMQASDQLAGQGERVLGLHDAISPGLRPLVCLAGTLLPFADAADDVLRRFAHVRLSASTVLRCTQAEGERLQNWRILQELAGLR